MTTTLPYSIYEFNVYKILWQCSRIVPILHADTHGAMLRCDMTSWFSNRRRYFGESTWRIVKI